MDVHGEITTNWLRFVGAGTSAQIRYGEAASHCIYKHNMCVGVEDMEVVRVYIGSPPGGGRSSNEKFLHIPQGGSGYPTGSSTAFQSPGDWQRCVRSTVNVEPGVAR